MLNIMLSLVAGTIVGYLIKLNISQKKLLENGYTLVIFLLILFMGVSIGANKSILQDLPKIGGYAVVISFCTVAGSIIGVMILEKTSVIK